MQSAVQQNLPLLFRFRCSFFGGVVFKTELEKGKRSSATHAAAEARKHGNKGHPSRHSAAVAGSCTWPLPHGCLPARLCTLPSCYIDTPALASRGPPRLQAPSARERKHGPTTTRFLTLDRLRGRAGTLGPEPEHRLTGGMSSWLTTLQSQSESLLTQLDAVAADQLTPARRGESGATAISNTFLVGDGEGPGSDAALASGQQRLQASSAAPLRDIASKSRPKVGVIAKSTTSGTASSGKSAAQLASENKMLLSEVSALQTEVADFATRVRRAQDQLSDKTSRLALCERQLRDLQRAHEDELLSHQQTSNQLAQSTKELSDTKAKVATLEKSNKSLLSDQAAFNVTGSAALENAQSNLAGVKASLEAERDQLAAALADAQDKAATHRADIHEMAVQRDTLEAEAAESKGEADVHWAEAVFLVLRSQFRPAACSCDLAHSLTHPWMLNSRLARDPAIPTGSGSCRPDSPSPGGPEIAGSGSARLCRVQGARRAGVANQGEADRGASRPKR